MRIMKYLAIVAVLAVAGCSSSDKSASDSPTTTAAPTTTTSGATTTTKATVPEGAPSAPREVSGAPYGSGVVKLFWKAPKSNGDAPIGVYIVTSFYGKTRQKTKAYASNKTEQTISGLQNGYGYTFEVAASNSSGTGPFSKRSAV